MGTILDTTIFIAIERAAGDSPAAVADVIGDVQAHLGEYEDVAIATITASELLHGVHRAAPRHRARREVFVEGVLAAFPTLAFDMQAARAHARMWAQLAAKGNEVGAHDRLIAATALSSGWRVATSDARDFGRIPGLDVLLVELA